MAADPATPDVWHVATLWVGTVALAMGVIVLLLAPVEIYLPLTTGLRLFSTLGFVLLLAGLVGVMWWIRRRPRAVNWNSLSIGLLLLLLTWGLVDGALRELANGNLLWMGVSAGAALGGMVASDSFLWRGFRPPAE